MHRLALVSFLCAFSSSAIAESCFSLSGRQFFDGNYYNSYISLYENHVKLGSDFSRQLKCQAGVFVQAVDVDCLEDIEDIDFSQFEYGDAFAEIAALARSKRIVILNESHSYPLHRAFAYRLAVELKREGYEYIALEALSNDGKEFNGDIRSSGYYTKEPVFADFIRRVIGMGYRLFPYTQTADQDIDGTIDEREEAQASNLYKIIESLPGDAKILVYVGYSHAAKRPIVSQTGSERRWMAARLWEKTGLEPLTIDQSVFAGVPAFGGRVGSFVIKKDGENYVHGRYSGVMDIQVVHSYNGREDWLEMLMGKSFFPLPDYFIPRAGKWNVQVFLDSEGFSGVPVDQVIVDSSGGGVMLDKGAKYSFRIEREKPETRICEPEG